MTYLEVEDDRPYEPQGELGVAVCNVIVANVHQFHLEEKQQGQSLTHGEQGDVSPTVLSPGSPQTLRRRVDTQNPGTSRRGSEATPCPGWGRGGGRIFHISNALHPEVLSQHLTALFQLARSGASSPKPPSTSA